MAEVNSADSGGGLVRESVRASAGYVPGEQPVDTRTIKLNTNENPYPPSPRVMEAIGRVTAEQLRRYPSPNARLFREAAARVHGVGAEQIMAFNGGDELLACAIRACAGEGTGVAYLEPSYSLYPVLTEVQGSRKVVIPYEEAGGSWRLPGGIEETDAAILLIVNPNAPTGHFNPVGRLEEIARKFRGVVLIDEAYVDFAGESALRLVREGNLANVVLLRTLSKGYSLAGLRFGYAVGPEGLLRQLEKVRDSYPVDAVAQAAATAAIEDQGYARGTWEKVVAERGRVSERLRGLGLVVPESASNFVLAQVPGGHGVTAKGVYEGLKARGILIRWWDLPGIADKVRITIGTPEQNDRLLGELGDLMSGRRH
jgi:histidinol-phosphate aminotransferase